MPNTELIEHQTVTAIVENVELAVKDMEEGFTLLQKASSRLHATFGGGSQYFHTLWNGSIHDYNIREADRLIADSRLHIRQNAWRYLFNQTGIKAYMTPRRAKELEDAINSKECPELSVENIMGTIHGLATRVNALLEESIKEVFDWLRPRMEWGVGALKTNSKWEVRKKCIVWGVESNYGGGFRANYYREQDFRALGNVFSLLDGKGAQRYPNDLYTRFNEMAQDPSVRSGETEYFKFKWFKNGNLHIEFKRDDLLVELNRIGGGAQIKKGERGNEDETAAANALVPL